MREWQKLPIDSLFEAGGEQIGSQRSYDRQIEINRRKFVQDEAVAAAQIDAAHATKETAKWTMISAIAVAISAVIAMSAFLYTVLQV